MSKVAMDRPRHVLVQLAAQTPVGRRAFAAALREQALADGWLEADVPQLTRFAWPHAAVRVPHERLAAARRLLPRIAAVREGGARHALTVVTLSTSGTLAALTRRAGVLADRADGKS
ncbi:MAG: hypothetical protein V4510_06075 [bacterium]